MATRARIIPPNRFASCLRQSLCTSSTRCATQPRRTVFTFCQSSAAIELYKSNRAGQERLCFRASLQTSLSDRRRTAARSYTTIRDLPPLPEPPAPAKGWPTPLLTLNTWLEYSSALGTRGWHVTRINDSSQRPLDSSVLSNSELQKTFQLSEDEFEKNVEQFISFINALEKEENHHVSMARDPTTCTLLLTLHTHSAIRPEQYEGEPRKDRKMPGITSRDVRFVILLEKTFSNAFNTPTQT